MGGSESVLGALVPPLIGKRRNQMHPDYQHMILMGSVAAVVAIGAKIAIITAIYAYAVLN